MNYDYFVVEFFSNLITATSFCSRPRYRSNLVSPPAKQGLCLTELVKEYRLPYVI